MVTRGLNAAKPGSYAMKASNSAVIRQSSNNNDSNGQTRSRKATPSQQQQQSQQHRVIVLQNSLLKDLIEPADDDAESNQMRGEEKSDANLAFGLQGGIPRDIYDERQRQRRQQQQQEDKKERVTSPDDIEDNEYVGENMCGPIRQHYRQGSSSSSFYAEERQGPRCVGKAWEHDDCNNNNDDDDMSSASSSSMESDPWLYRGEELQGHDLYTNDCSRLQKSRTITAEVNGRRQEEDRLRQAKIDEVPLTGKKALYYSRKARPVDFQPYTLKDYKHLKSDKYYEIKTRTMPDLNSDELMAKRAVRDLVKDFSNNLKAINLRKIANQPKKDNKGSKEPSKREKALLFAQKIPKPKVPSPSITNAPSMNDTLTDTARPDSGGDSTIWGTQEEGKRLRELEAAYENSKGKIEAMQKAFGLLSFK